jgi:AcrR family transcriptional regulator
MLELASAGSRRRKLARPRELLDAALTAFVEKGFAATRAEEIAARAGVSKGTLYLYFDSKEDLLKTLIAEGFSSRIELPSDKSATGSSNAHPRFPQPPYRIGAEWFERLNFFLHRSNPCPLDNNKQPPWRS